MLLLWACVGKERVDDGDPDTATAAEWTGLGTPGWGPRPQTRTFVQVSLEGTTACGLDDAGEVSCWGSGDYGVLGAPAGPFQSISVGHYAACAVPVGGGLRCWGTTSPFADAFNAGFDVVGVSVGWSHICALDDAGSVGCWGESPSGETDAPGGAFSELDVGANVSCALDVEGFPECWGTDQAGTQDEPVVALFGLSAGQFQECGIFDDDGDGAGGIVAWTSDWGDYYAPPPPSGDDFVQVECTWWGSCGRTREGALECAGYGDRAERAGPYATFATSQSGLLCAIRPEGTIECWDPWYGEDGYDPSFVQESGILRPPR